MKSEEKATPATVEGTGSRTEAEASGVTTTRKEMNLRHAAYRVCDTVYCKHCGKSWDVKDEAPDCIPRSRYLRRRPR